MAEDISRDMDSEIKSFEIADGDSFGDILSKDRRLTDKPSKIGLFAIGFFEFWRQYSQLKEQVLYDANVVYERLSAKHDIVYPGLVDTMDTCDEAGRIFRSECVDIVIMAYRTYLPDVYVHHMLSYLPHDMPILFFASQSRDAFDWNDGYCGVYRNCGIMAEMQLVTGLHKMGRRKSRVEVVAGSVHDDEAYTRMDRYINAVTAWKQLQHMNIGVIGQVFRGMFDFEYDKTKVKNTLGPEVFNIQADLLVDAFETTTENDPQVKGLLKFAREECIIEGIGDADLVKAARAGAALIKLVKRLRLDGISVLGQHLIERKLGTTTYLGMAELHREGKCPTVTEGDVIGLIMMKIMHHLTGNTAFMVEWGEFDVGRNAWCMLGHGFGDPSQARNGQVKLKPSAECWGLTGTGLCMEFVPKPGPCTMAHMVDEADGQWKMLIVEGEILDLEPLPISETHALVRIERPIKEFTEMLTKEGFPHHGITVRGDIVYELEQIADLLGMRVVRL